jgi:hypothetical protein
MNLLEQWEADKVRILAMLTDGRIDSDSAAAMLAHQSGFNWVTRGARYSPSSVPELAFAGDLCIRCQLPDPAPCQ